MSIPTSPSRTVTLLLFLTAGLLPLAAWLWFAVHHLATTTTAHQAQQLEALRTIKKKLFDQHMAELLADVRLLALTVEAGMPVNATPDEVRPAPKEAPLAVTGDEKPAPGAARPPAVPADETPAHKAAQPLSGNTPPAAATPTTTPVAPENEALQKTMGNELSQKIRLFLQRHLDHVKQVSTEAQLGAKLGGIDWIYRNNGRRAGGEKWLQFAQTFTPKLDAFKKTRKYDDLYLISTKGDIVYTSGRGSELGANIMDPVIKGSGLHRLFLRAVKEVTFEEDPLPDAKRTSGYIGAPVRREGQLMGIIAIRFNLNGFLNALLSERMDSMRDAVAIIGSDGGTRYLNAAWAQIPDDLQGRFTKPGPTTAPAQEILTPEGTGFQVLRQTFKMDQHPWTLLLATPRASEPPPPAAPVAPPEPPPEPPVQQVPTTPPDTKLPSAPVISPPPGQPEEHLSAFGKNYLELTGYYDLFLIHPDGMIFHTATQQADHGTNLISGPYADTNLGHLFQRVLTTRQPGLSDVAPYPPSRNEPAAFVAAPIVINDKVVRVVALQRPLERLNTVLDPGTLLGPEGEMVLVGSDFRMRSDSMRDPRTHSVTASFRGTVADNGMETEAVRLALSGQSGVLTTPLPRGGEQITAFTPVTMDQETWVLLAMRPTDPRLVPLAHAGRNLWILLGGSILWIVLLALLAAHLTGRPWQQLGQVTMQLARGRTELLKERNWEIWREAMEPLRLVMERFFQQAVRLHSSHDKLMEFLARWRTMMEPHVQGSAIREVTVDTSDSPEALLEAISRWQQLPAMAPPSPAGKAVEGVSQELSELLNRIQEIAHQVSLLSINTASLAARTTVKKSALVEPCQNIRELAETIHHLANDGQTLTHTWRQKLTLTPQGPKVDDILAALLRRVEYMLTLQSRAIKSRAQVEPVDWQRIRPLFEELAQQGDRLRQIIEALPRKEEP
ncbi:MAG: cache domain-containing protein [Magnetococcales bacterium]|nr:cache domain-containing protein [Magnetococcales bacterium]MBF0150952.1 cache domain-containing protein [Magnetococcales bacterium]